MWWLKARRAHTVLPIALGTYVVLLAAVRDTSVALPSLTGGGQVVLALFVPVPLVAALMLCLDSRLTAPEATGIRPLPAMDTLLIVATVCCAVLLSAAVAVVFSDWQAVTAGRNTLFLTGLLLCARPVLGQPAALAPVGWLMIVALIGFRPGNDPAPWTVVPEPLGAPHAALGALLLFVAGLAVQLRTSRNPS